MQTAEEINEAIVELDRVIELARQQQNEYKRRLSYIQADINAKESTIQTATKMKNELFKLKKPTC